MAAPAELRTPHMHRATRSLLESADGSMATVATRREKNFSLRKRKETHYEPRISLTPTGLLMEGHFTQNPYRGDFERNRDVSITNTACVPAMRVRASSAIRRGQLRCVSYRLDGSTRLCELLLGKPHRCRARQQGP